MTSSSLNLVKKTRVIFLLCGSFNPITILHLRLFDVAHDQLSHKYDICGGIISPVNDNYVKSGLVEGRHRIAMVDLALSDRYELVSDDWEIQQSKWSPTRQTLEILTNRLKQMNTNKLKKRQKMSKSHWIDEWNGDENFVVKLLCGADLLESFAVPGLWVDSDVEYILQNHGLVVISREGCDANKFIHDNDITYKYRANIDQVINCMGCDISSTKIRRSIRRGDSIRYLVAESVVQYISHHKLYLDDAKPTDTKQPIITQL